VIPKEQTTLNGYCSDINMSMAQEAVDHLVYGRPFRWSCSPTIFHKFPHFAVQATTDADGSWRARWPESLHHLPDYRGVFGNLEERNTAGEYLRVYESKVTDQSNHGGQNLPAHLIASTRERVNVRGSPTCSVFSLSTLEYFWGLPSQGTSSRTTGK